MESKTLKKENKASVGQDRATNYSEWDPTLVQAIIKDRDLKPDMDSGYPGISAKDIENITYLDLHNQNIKSLNGIENLRNLKDLYLNDNQISDITPLGSLSKLDNLNLSHNQISDITPIKGLNNLGSLDLSHNQISDIAPIKERNDLVNLDLSYNQISDITPLGELSKLDELYLDHNQISDIASIKEMNLLRTLLLNDNKIRDLKPIEKWSKQSNVSLLQLNNNQISDLTPLENLKQLEELQLGSNRISDITPLKGLNGLRILNLNNNRISDLMPLKDLKDLQSLYLNNNRIFDITPLKELTSLLGLYLSGNHYLKDITTLADLKILTHLDLSKCEQVGNIKALENLKKLDYLNLSKMILRDITPIANLSNLKYLDLHTDLISDITPVGKLTNLQYLDLSINKFDDIAPIANLTQLRYLNLSDLSGIGGRSISFVLKNIESLKKLKNLIYLDLRSNNIDNVESLRDLKNLVYLDLSINNIKDLRPLKDLTNLKYLYLQNNNIADITPLEKLILLNTNSMRTPDIYGIPKGDEDLAMNWERHTAQDQTEYVQGKFGDGTTEKPKKSIVNSNQVKVYISYDDDDQLCATIDFQDKKPAIDLRDQIVHLDVKETSNIIDLNKYIKVLNYNNKVPIGYLKSAETYLNLNFLPRVNNNELNTRGKCTTDQLIKFDYHNGKILPNFNYKLSVPKAADPFNINLTVPGLITVPYSGNFRCKYNIKEPIKASMAYEPDPTIAFRQQDKVRDPKDGFTFWTNDPKQADDPSKEVDNPVNGLTKVGNKEVTTTDEDNKHIVTTTFYDVDSKTGDLSNPKVISKIVTETKTEIIKADVEYIADDSLEYEQRKTEIEAVDGSKEVTYETDETPGHEPKTKVIKEHIIKPATTGKIRVGNVLAQSGWQGDDEVLSVAVYDVDRATGNLTGRGKRIAKARARISYEYVDGKVSYQPDPDLKFGETKVIVPNKGGRNLCAIFAIEGPAEKRFHPHDSRIAKLWKLARQRGDYRIVPNTSDTIPITIIDAEDVPHSTRNEYSIVEPIEQSQDGVTKVGNKKVETDKDGNTTITTYNVDPKTGKLDLEHPNKVTVNKVEKEVIPATTVYEPDDTVNFGKTKVTTPATDGERKVTYLTVETPDTRYGKKDSKVVKDVVNGVTKVGNKKVETDKDGNTTITTYNVDPKTGKLDLEHPNKVTVNKVEKEVIPATTVYEPDDTVDFNQTKVVTPAANGERKVTYLTVETPDTRYGKKESQVTKDAINGVTKVGNVEIIINPDSSKTVKTYDVNPMTGKLENPKTIGIIGKVTINPIRAIITYIADPNVDFGQDKVVIKPKDGLQTTTNMDVIKNGQIEHHNSKVEIIDPINGVTHVGNVEVIVNSDGSKTVKTYQVNPTTGKLNKEQAIVTLIPAPLVNHKPEMSEPIDTHDEFSNINDVQVNTDDQIGVNLIYLPDSKTPLVLAKGKAKQAKAEIPTVKTKAEKQSKVTKNLPQTGIVTHMLVGLTTMIASLGLIIKKRK